MTLSLQVADLVLVFAVIVTEPVLRAVTTPLLFTVATLLFELVKLTVVLDTATTW